MRRTQAAAAACASGACTRVARRRTTARPPSAGLHATPLNVQRSSGAPVGVVVADLDHFKAVNDRFGHAEGDAVLKDVAYALRKALRAFDLVYRIGGEEFLVLLPGADTTATTDIAEGLRAAVCERPLGNGQNITVSLGIAASSDGNWDYEELFRQADEALYRAKAAGRNCVCGDSAAPVSAGA